MRQDILSLMDGFIEQIQQIRKLLLGVSLSAIVLAPLALILSIYLFLHPSFFAVLEIENDFGLVLTILLGAVIIISVVWLYTGIRQYWSMSTWKERYSDYAAQKEQMDKRISSELGLDEQEQQ
jgi:hypothetical protein